MSFEANVESTSELSLSPSFGIKASLHVSSFQGHLEESASAPLIGQSTFTNADWIVGQQLCDVDGSQQSENDTDEKRG